MRKEFKTLKLEYSYGIYSLGISLKGGENIVLNTDDVSIIRKFKYLGKLVAAEITTKYETDKILIKLSDNQTWEDLILELNAK